MGDKKDKKKVAFGGVMSRLMRCWSFKKCGRETEADCPAVAEDFVYCWLIAGTLCGGKVQGTFAQKVGTCQKCDYYLYAKGFMLGKNPA